MPAPPFKILFLCTGNAARSIFAEYLIGRIAPGRFDSYSAGARPQGAVNPFTLRVLREIYHIRADEARSKSWEEYRDVSFDWVITVCDNARESCPAWPGQPVVAHWSSPDPGLFVGPEEAIFQGFAKVALQIQHRLDLLCSIPLEKLDRLRLAELAQDIGNRSQF